MCCSIRSEWKLFPNNFVLPTISHCVCDYLMGTYTIFNLWIFIAILFLPHAGFNNSLLEATRARVSDNSFHSENKRHVLRTVTSHAENILLA